MNMEQYIIYQGQEYQVPEPTILLWKKLTLEFDLQDPDNFSISVISKVTGIPSDEIKKAPWKDIHNAANYITEILFEDTQKFYETFEFMGTTYKFIDLDNITFGEFIDIDNFLQKPESYRKANINFLLALFYRPVDRHGNYEEYDVGKLMERARDFNQLPIKYLFGANRFFLLLENILQRNTPSYSGNILRVLYNKIKRKIPRVLRSSGVGISQS